MPTFDVSDDQANILLGVFGSPEAYIAWLQNEVVGYVLAKKQEEITAELAVEAANRLETARAQLLGLRADLLG
jgi:hypothetical protein